jgi:hypothetical protein
VAGVLCALVVLWAIVYALAPVLAHPQAIDQFHELPFWNPYACGGHPAWGGFESDTVVVSPWLPAYALLPLPVAMRVEILGSTLWAALGAWLLASRFTRSPAARALVAVLFAVSSRWTFQLALGHTWHMVYAWMPWVLLLFDRAAGEQPLDGPRRTRSAVWAGVCLAMMLYAGGVHVLPHAVLAIALYALLLAFSTRSARPLGALALSWVVAVGLAAPKLLPILEPTRAGPPPLESTDALNPQQIMHLLTDPVQSFTETPQGIYDAAWPNVAMYLGWPALLLVGAGVFLARGPRARALTIVGAIFVVLGIGSFTPYAPWALAHRLPVLASQPVASWWLYPALLLMACAATGAAETALARSGRARAAIEIGLTIALVWIARDIAWVARQPLVDQLQAVGPTTAESTAAFRTESRLPSALAYQVADPAPSSLSAEMANVGTVECSTFEDLANYSGMVYRMPPYDARPGAIGAHGVGDPGYHGEVYLAEGKGSVRFDRWSPSAFDVQIDGAEVGELVVVNQNWDPGWRVDGETALDHDHTIAARVSSPSQTMSFRYRPRGWWPGIALFLVTVFVLLVPRAVPRAIRSWASRIPWPPRFSAGPVRPPP